MNETLALVTDLHLNEPFTDKYNVDGRANWLRILQDISQKGITDLMILGDLSEGGGLAFFFESVRDNHLNLKLVLGNHDHFDEMGKHTNLQAFMDLGKFYYFEEDEFNKYLYLDSSADIIDSKQLEWFEMASKTDKDLFVFIHHPILDCNTEMDKAYPLEEREKLEDILNLRTQNTYIFCGHYHIDHVITNGLITQIITPATSIQINPETAKVDAADRNIGYRVLNIDHKTISHEVVWF